MQTCDLPCGPCQSDALVGAASLVPHAEVAAEQISVKFMLVAAVASPSDQFDSIVVACS